MKNDSIINNAGGVDTYDNYQKNRNDDDEDDEDNWSKAELFIKQANFGFDKLNYYIVKISKKYTFEGKDVKNVDYKSNQLVNFEKSSCKFIIKGKNVQFPKSK